MNSLKLSEVVLFRIFYLTNKINTNYCIQCLGYVKKWLISDFFIQYSLHKKTLCLVARAKTMEIEKYISPESQIVFYMTYLYLYIFFFSHSRRHAPYFGQPDYRVYELNKRLQQRTEVSFTFYINRWLQVWFFFNFAIRKSM